MDKKTLVTVGVIVLMIVGGATYVWMSKPMDLTKDTAGQPDASSQTMPPPASDMVTKGRYSDYMADQVAQSKGDKLLFFHASWCPQCRALDADIKNSLLPDNLTIFKVDYDTHQDLRQKYGVTLQTTFVKIDDSGNKIKSYVAYDEPTFAAVKRELLP